jgi:hypothetical protein
MIDPILRFASKSIYESAVVSEEARTPDGAVKAGMLRTTSKPRK